MELTTIVLGIAGFLAAGALTMIFKKQAALERAQGSQAAELASARLHAAETYVTKVDYKDDIAELKSDIKLLLGRFGVAHG